MSRILLSNISIDIYNLDSILNKFREAILTKSKIQVITLNALMFNQILFDKEFAKIISGAVVSADSIGITWAIKFLTGIKINRLPGIDLVSKICSIAVNSNYKIFLLGAKPGIAEKASKKLQLRFPGLKIVGAEHGYFSLKDEQLLIEKINTSKADILFAALPASFQEKFIYKNITKLNACVSIGVGGSFDVIAGNLRRAPIWVQQFGFEWLFRLLQQPWRIVRMKSLPFFVWNIFKIKLHDIRGI